MIICTNDEDCRTLTEIVTKLGQQELCGQVSEECAELTQAAQKLRRVLAGTTPVTWDEALASLMEEAADVLICIDALEVSIIQGGKVREIAAKKLKRWHERTFPNRPKGE